MSDVTVIIQPNGVETTKWVLQTPNNEGKTFTWVPEGVDNSLGSGAGFARRYTHRGFRRRLVLRWEYGTTSKRYVATGGGSWSAPTVHPTAAAISEILQWASMSNVRVVAPEGMGLPDFLARAPEQDLVLSDVKGVAHGDLELTLDATTLVPSIRLSGDPGWGGDAWGTAPWGG
jgi:hypothetical protein